nr:ADP-ribosylglycohydrolase family protein [Streptomyces sp. NRRL S-1022]
MASIARTAPVPAPGETAGLRERARGALLGLAVGDALGAPAENLRPSEIRARWGRITGYVSEQPCGTDDTEYAIFSGLLLARHGSALTPAHVEAAWHEWIADRAEGPFRGAGFSERGTLENLRRGLAAPISAQHRHAWSDGLAMRAAPFGVFAAGRPAEAARLVAVDGSVSHEGEGIYGGQAVAAGVAAAMTGASVPVVIAAALAVIPDDSWTARSLRRAVAVAHRGERAVRSAVVIGGYPWTDLAPEAVALAFGAYAAADGDFREAVLTAVNMGRDADTTAAVAGALSGATQGVSAIPSPWATAIGPARGRCLPSVAGHHVLEIAEVLAAGGVGETGAEVPDGATGPVPTETLPGAVPTEVLPGAEPAVALPGTVPTEVLAGTMPAEVLPDAEPALVLPGTVPTKLLPGAEPAVALPGAVPTEVLPDTEPAVALPGTVPTEVLAGTVPAEVLPGAEPALALPGTEPAEVLPGTVPTELLSGAEPAVALPGAVPAGVLPGAGTKSPPPPVLASQPTESGGGWAEERGSRGRSPLVGAGNAGQPDSGQSHPGTGNAGPPHSGQSHPVGAGNAGPPHSGQSHPGTGQPDSGRSPLVGAGNGGPADGEGRP